VLDASAVLALVQEEPGSERLWPLCPQAVVSAVNAGEVLAKLIARGMPHMAAQAAFDALHLTVLPFDAGDAVRSAAYVGPGVSLGDRCFLACASRNGAGWTSDRHLAGIASPSLPPLEMFR
jgi:PIN domain nuclease of toxin-antitoxin system